MIINGGNQAHGMVFVVEKRGVGSIWKFALDVKEPDMGLHAEAPMSCLVIDGWAYSHVEVLVDFFPLIRVPRISVFAIVRVAVCKE